MRINGYKLVNTKIKAFEFEKIYDSFDKRVKGEGYVPASNKSYFHNTKFKVEPVEGLYVNFGFKFGLIVLNEILYLLVIPKRFLTKDGKAFDQDFHDSQKTYLSINPIKYTDYIDVIETFQKEFGEMFLIEDWQFELSQSIPNEELDSTGAEPNILFGENQERDTFPARGLKNHGPWDVNASSSMIVPNPIWVGLMGVDAQNSVLSKVKNGDPSSSYGYKGFQSVYRVGLDGSKQDGVVDISEDDFLKCNNADEFRELITENYKKFSTRKPDVLIIKLPNSIMQKIYNVDLHDWLKVIFWRNSQPTQILLKSTLDSRGGSMVENIALGIYVSAGGRPWILDEPFVNQMFVGIGFGRKSDNNKVVGIMEVIDNYGLTLDMQLAQLNTSAMYDKDLHLEFEDFKQFIDKAIEDYSKKYGVESKLERIVIHKTTSFNDNEKKIVQYCNEKGIKVSLAHIELGGRGIALINEDKYQLPSRLTFWKPEKNKAVLYTTGKTSFSSNSPFIPKPVMISVSEDSEYDLKQACIDIIKLTKLNWNSVNSFEKYPVTLTYAISLANMLKMGLVVDNLNCDIKYIF